mgnify:CR=1 FL=1
MEIKFFAYIRYYTGEKQTNWDAPVNDLSDLLKQLSLKYGKKFNDTVFNQDQTELSSLIMILVNGRYVKDLNGIHTELFSGDKVSILPAATGG